MYICEIGCGLGYFTNRLYRELCSNNDNPLAMNDEPSAINYELFDLVVIKEVLWYVCHKLDHFIQNVLSVIKKDGFLYVSQSFPESDKYVGQEIIDSPERLKGILAEHVKPISICFEREFRNSQGQYVH